MPQPEAHKCYRCRYCGHVFNTWVPAAKRPDGTLLCDAFGPIPLYEITPMEVDAYVSR